MNSSSGQRTLKKKQRVDWLTVKNFGKVKYFNLSYVVIFGVPILAIIYETINAPLLTGLYTIQFPLKLKLIFSASLLYAIAITIYQYFCDPIVRKFDTIEDYIRDVHITYERAFPDKKFEIIIANLIENQSELKAELISLQTEINAGTANSGRRNRYIEMIELLYPSCVQRNLAKNFDFAVSEKNWAALYISYLLYISGTIVLLIVLVWQSIIVFKQ